MILIDTSIWIAIFRDRTGAAARRLSDFVSTRTVATAAVVRCEVLQGALNDAEWNSVTRAFLSLEQLPIPDEIWIDAARMSFDLRRKGKTIRSTIDCCIAQLALNHKAELVHNDRDFEIIATLRPLNHIRLDLTKASPL